VCRQPCRSDRSDAAARACGGDARPRAAARPDGTKEGFATLEEILRLKSDTKVIIATGHGARESALKAISLGAYDFYKKPSTSTIWG